MMCTNECNMIKRELRNDKDENTVHLTKRKRFGLTCYLYSHLMPTDISGIK
jgi:hypothetical protein